MPVYSHLLSTEIKNLLTEKYDKIKMQVTGFNQDGGMGKLLTFTLVDEVKKLRKIEIFIKNFSGFFSAK